MSPKGIDSYIKDLSRRLDVGPLRRRRILTEARDHLTRSIDQDLSKGGDREAAKQHAIDSFGDPESVASYFKNGSEGKAGTTSVRSGGGNPHQPFFSSRPRTASYGRGALRRYPALAFVAVAAALALLLPTALNIPQSGPTNLAEYAPVPGKGEGESQLSDLSQANSGGLGFGSGRGQGSLGSGLGNLGSPGQKRPKLKRCVGDPPRQTEDELSPPCVAYFEGNNFGATAKGVTRDEVRIVIVEHCSTNADDGARIDYGDPNAPNADSAVAAYQRYFTDRYQMYGRKAHFFGAKSCPRSTADRAASDRNFIASLDERWDPFAIVYGVVREAQAREAARRGILTNLESPMRSLTLDFAPHILSFEPDLEDSILTSAEFLCQKLAGRPARLSGEPLDMMRNRKFGLVYDQDNDPDGAGRDLLKQEVRNRCGTKAGELVEVSPDDEQQAVTTMRTEDVTTVIKYSNSISLVLSAEGIGWHPEWYLPGTGGSNENHSVMPASQWRNAFGFTFFRRLRVRAQEPAHQAFYESCPGCPGRGNPFLYNILTMLFWGIQSAGPRLTPANVDHGLHAIPQRQSLDPYTPAAYFAPGNYSWIKDSAAMWWDPSGVPPNGRNPGCYRLVEDGLRYRQQDWRNNPGDEGFKGSGQPCQGNA